VARRRRIGLEQTVTTVRQVVAACALAAGVWSTAAGAQTPPPGWTLVVRIVPNPVGFGTCAGISIEAQDPDGYRTTSMSNGQPLDFRRFTYTADTTNFQWRGGNSTDGILCTRMPGTPSQTTVTVTLPDGLSGSAVLTSVPPGSSPPAVQYAPQAPLRGHGVPTPRRAAMMTATPQGAAPGSASGGVAAGAESGAASGGGGAAPAGGSAPTKPTRTPGATPLGKAAPGTPGSYQPQSIQAAALQMTGMGLAFAALHVDGAPLQMTGNGVAFAPALVTAEQLGMVGNGFAPAPMTVDAAPLALTGNGIAFAPQTIAATKLSMTGQAP
jgi:hypothetical protein